MHGWMVGLISGPCVTGMRRAVDRPLLEFRGGL